METGSPARVAADYPPPHKPDSAPSGDRPIDDIDRFFAVDTRDHFPGSRVKSCAGATGAQQASRVSDHLPVIADIDVSPAQPLPR